MSALRRLCAGFLSFLLSLSLSPQTRLPAPVGEAAPVAAAAGLSISGISARSAILLDATDGARRILWEQNAGERLGMASTTKIMTALVALEAMPVSTVIRIPAEAVGIEGSSIYLNEGEKLSLEQLLFGVLLQSANDAAAAVAIAVGGSIADFAGLMNQKAAELGLQDTHFTNPHGLDDADHYTTARDLALITAAALENDLFRSIVSTYRKEIPSPEESSSRLLINHNRLLRSYEGCIGVKTGFTKATGRCLVSAAERNGLRLISVTLNDGDDWTDHAAILNAGFAAFEAVDLTALCTLPSLTVSGGEQSSVLCRTERCCRAVLPVGHGPITTRVELPHFVFAPVYAGTAVGTLSFFCDGMLIGSCDLTAAFSAAALPRRGFFNHRT